MGPKLTSFHFPILFVCRLVSSGESVRLVFKSDRSRNKRGFRIEYKYFFAFNFGNQKSLIPNFLFEMKTRSVSSESEDVEAGESLKNSFQAF